jgi:hypothetical protein
MQLSLRKPIGKPCQNHMEKPMNHHVPTCREQTTVKPGNLNVPAYKKNLFLINEPQVQILDNSDE